MRLQTMVSGILLVLGLRTRMQNPCVHVLFAATTAGFAEALDLEPAYCVGPMIKRGITGCFVGEAVPCQGSFSVILRGCRRNQIWPCTDGHLEVRGAQDQVTCRPTRTQLGLLRGLVSWF